MSLDPAAAGPFSENRPQENLAAGPALFPSRPKVGDRAQVFRMPDLDGNMVDLSSFQGKRTLVSFFRGASCPFCNLRVHQLIEHYPDFEKAGVEVIVFFAASREAILQYAGKQRALFPIIPDPGLSMYRKYGIEQSFWSMLKTMSDPLRMFRIMFSGYFNLKSVQEKPVVPADFLLGENLEILKIHWGNHFGDHLPFDSIFNQGSVT